MLAVLPLRVCEPWPLVLGDPLLQKVAVTCSLPLLVVVAPPFSQSPHPYPLAPLRAHASQRLRVTIDLGVLSVAPVTVHRPGDLCQRAVQGQGTSDSLTPITTNARGDIVVVSVLMPSGPTPLRPYCTLTSRRRQRNEYLYLPCTVQSAPVHGAAVHVRVSQ